MSANPRLFQGDVFNLSAGVVQFSTWQYYTTEDGNDVLSTSPSASVSGAQLKDVKLPGGDLVGKVK